VAPIDKAPGADPRRSAAEAVGFGGKLRPSGWRVEFRPYQNPAKTQLGWLRIERPSGEITDGHKLMIGPRGKRFVPKLSEQQRNPDGTPRLFDGKPAYRPTQDFRTKEIGRRFEENVLEVLRADHPELFEGEEVQDERG
jgi:hypothetical protein